jgi:hypothetical protein
VLTHHDQKSRAAAAAEEREKLQRLRQMQMQGQSASASAAAAEGGEGETDLMAVSGDGQTQAQAATTQIVYSEGSPQLRDARAAIAEFSLPRYLLPPLPRASTPCLRSCVLSSCPLGNS